MKWIQTSIIICLIVIIGALLNIAFQNQVSIPIKISSGVERLSPEDHIKEENIKVYEDKVIINIQNPQWAGFTNTNSMDPIIDEYANSIQIIPVKEEEIHIGDIVSYESDYAEGRIIHRVVFVEKDEFGTYYYIKGDNNIFRDPGRIRFEQIRRVTVGILY
ncbi:hypothetical protein CMO90_03460 [Candidatus Woesearchaeota archaeon]|jgi:hypothetical protein|nr:hypothetical protein [Candidatus Woesearchaeota archaeon]|tara:strand:- start:119 stop:601 length:483 start_codon:yes stop_codon:yes gene_type:complete